MMALIMAYFQISFHTSFLLLGSGHSKLCGVISMVAADRNRSQILQKQRNRNGSSSWTGLVGAGGSARQQFNARDASD